MEGTGIDFKSGYCHGIMFVIWLFSFITPHTADISELAITSSKSQRVDSLDHV